MMTPKWVANQVPVKQASRAIPDREVDFLAKVLPDFHGADALTEA